ncbi:mitochondrial carrier protein [Plasmodium cynomolgi strain B]|uniref:Mitochondrial carrier protein n=1 Tax=Plasmodium cynomolgi (strain B) TaxID=1120755 RepID=K6UPM9_PLACD|nr:mitochondrial carrier protein [Plasmodium cynomolgi strain B]GAB64589.1 mitochondrial carrier protein [Plasmodium cynomolgi strain B]
MLQTLYGSIIASTLSRVLLYPIDTVKINKQVDTSNTQVRGTAKPTIHAGTTNSLKTGGTYFFLPAFIHQFGYRGLYSGFVFSAMTTIPATSLYFCCFEYLKWIKIKWNQTSRDEKTGSGQTTNSLSFLNYFTIAFLAEAMSCVLFVPIDVIKERLQAQRYLQLKEYRTSYHLVKDLVCKEGFFRLYRGYVSTCLTYGVFGGSFFFLQNGIKKLWSEGSGRIFNLFKGNLYRCSLVCLSMTMNVTIIDLYKQFA